MSRAIIILAGLAALSVLAFLGCDGSRASYEPPPESDVAAPEGTERIELAMGDFCFYPQELHLPAGKTVQLAIRNLGNIRHEFMVGRELGGHGYEEDFFAGLEDIRVSGDPRDYQWEMEAEDAHGEGGEEVEGGHGHGGGGGSTTWNPEGETWDCAGQVMGRGEDVDYDRFAHMAAMPDDMGGPMTNEDTPMDEPMDEGMDAHDEAQAQGGEVWELNIDAGGVAYMTFTVPEDYKGEWETGCFIPRHYERGMGSRIIVE